MSILQNLFTPVGMTALACVSGALAWLVFTLVRMVQIVRMI